MKRIYQRPTIEMCEVDPTAILAASPSIGGNTGITTGEGEPPSGGDAKQWLPDDGHGSADNSWDNWDD